MGQTWFDTGLCSFQELNPPLGTASTLDDRGAIGHFLFCNTLTDQVTWLAIKDSRGRWQQIRGLKPRSLQPELCSLTKTQEPVEGWIQRALQAAQHEWVHITDPTGGKFWLRTKDGRTSYHAPFSVQIATADGIAEESDAVVTSIKAVSDTNWSQWTREDQNCKCFVTTKGKGPAWHEVRRTVVIDKSTGKCIRDNLVEELTPDQLKEPLPQGVHHIETTLHYAPTREAPWDWEETVTLSPEVLDKQSAPDLSGVSQSMTKAEVVPQHVVIKDMSAWKPSIETEFKASSTRSVIR
eukprot:6127766-Amphidinium_carterae.2